MIAVLLSMLAGATVPAASPPSFAGRTCGNGSCWPVPQPPPLEPSHLIAYAQIICGHLEAGVVTYNEQDRRLPEISEIGAVLRTGDRRERVRLVPQEHGGMIDSGAFRKSVYVAPISEAKPGNGILDDGSGRHIDVTDTGFCPPPK